MLQSRLIFLGFLVFVGFLCVQGKSLPLFFYGGFPVLIFPMYYLIRTQIRWLGAVTSLISIAIFSFYLIHYKSTEVVLLGIGVFAILGLLIFYDRYWLFQKRKEERYSEDAHRAMEMLQQKHQSRAESLENLEKQVFGLLNLYELARDFGECLSFETIAELLFKNVRSELIFERMLLILYDKEEAGSSGVQIYSISDSGVLKNKTDLTDIEKQVLEEIEESRDILQQEHQWFFRLSTKSLVRAALIIDGANELDLAKFEVLSAFLTLHVKKIRLYETVKELAIRDSLTGVFVRRHFLERFSEELKRSVKFKLPLAVLMLDIDHFKSYNDDHGHLAGDATLKQVAFLLKENLRRVDIVARYGGEEFVVVIPETQQEGASEVAERIRSGIARHSFKIYDQEAKVTVSIGVSVYPNDTKNFLDKENISVMAFELIRHADRALYRAKEEGRNRVVLFRDLKNNY